MNFLLGMEATIGRVMLRTLAVCVDLNEEGIFS